jgi:phosphatidylinositol glycan class A protein
VRGRAGIQSFALIDRLKRYYGCGIWAGKLFCICVVVDYLLFVLLEFFAPRAHIDVVRDWPKKETMEVASESEKIDDETVRKRSSKFSTSTWPG